MNNKTFSPLFSVALGALLSPLAAQASNHESQVEAEHMWSQGWYLGGQFGLAKTDVSENGLDKLYEQAGINASSTKVDDSGASYSLFLGYKFNQYISLEAGYTDLGDRSVEFSGQAIDLDAYYDLAENVYPETADGFSLSVLGTYPISERFSVTGKLGYFDWEMDAVTSSLSDESDTLGDDSRSGSGVWLGAELGYQINHDLQAYVSYQHMPLDADDVGVVSLGFRYWFGASESKSTVNTQVKAATSPKSIVPVAVKDSDKDGVFDGQDRCANTPQSHVVNTKGCTEFAPRVAEIKLTVLYENDSDKIDVTYTDKIQKLADFINEYDVKEITVFGHTSAAGSREYNQKLSERRAASVAEMLSTNFHISAEIITVVGKGESELISENPDDNRRIEVYLNEELNLPVLKQPL
ncbi:OmpA family protein [uncultured Shewanella sp.]|uniref:OmpA family protein n=1 Tax=Shewanella atlantica TaxID=271099 RepID=UPI002608888A|nr:OmpA family protein [uncultured Shewanella sp.]